MDSSASPKVLKFLLVLILYIGEIAPSTCSISSSNLWPSYHVTERAKNQPCWHHAIKCTLSLSEHYVWYFQNHLTQIEREIQDFVRCDEVKQAQFILEQPSPIVSMFVIVTLIHFSLGPACQVLFPSDVLPFLEWPKMGGLLDIYHGIQPQDLPSASVELLLPPHAWQQTHWPGRCIM